MTTLTTLTTLTMTTLTQQFTIKAIHAHDDDFLFVANDDRVWIMGCNRRKRLGVDTEARMQSPARTEIQLGPDETIKQFYQREHLVVVYTSCKRLFISRVLKPSLSADLQTSTCAEIIRDSEGLYPFASENHETPLCTEDPDVAMPYQPVDADKIFSWPGAQDTVATPECRLSETSDEESDDSQEPNSDWDSDLDSDSPSPTSINADQYQSAQSFIRYYDIWKIIGGPAPVFFNDVRAVAESTDHDAYLLIIIFLVHSVRGLRVTRAFAEGLEGAVREDLAQHADHPYRSLLDSVRAMGWDRPTVDEDADVDSDPDSNTEKRNEYAPSLAESRASLLESPPGPDWSAHDFGFGPECVKNNRNFIYASSGLRSVHFASKPGFTEALTDIDEITCAVNMIFFRRGDKHYVYNWRLFAAFAMLNNAGIALSPTQHRSSSGEPILTYYQLHLPSTPDLVQYRSNYVYMHSGPMHHVFTSFPHDVDNGMGILWRYFELDNITADDIYVYNIGDMFVHQGTALYQYFHITKSLQPITVSTTQAPISMLRREDGSIRPFCISVEGDYIHCSGIGIICGANDLAKHMIWVHQFGPTHSYIVITDSKSHSETLAVQGDRVYFNINHIRSYHLFNNGIFYADTAGILCFCTHTELPQSKIFPRVTTINIDQHTFYVHNWLGLPGPVDRIYGSTLMHQYNTPVFSVGNSYYACVFDHGIPSSHSMITLNLILNSYPTSQLVSLVNPSLIDRNQYTNWDNVSISIQTNADKLEKLISMAEMFSNDSRYSFSLVCKSKIVSHGSSIAQIFVDDALSQFASTYLTSHASSTLTSFNLQAFANSTAPQLYTFGRMLHLAMIVTSTALTIRLPLALLVATKQTEPTIAELEFLALKANSLTFEQVWPLKHDAARLADCGYSCYRECLEHLVQYDNSNDRIKAISQIMAQGFLAFSPIKNLAKMNIPTLDYYMSGPYTIDRAKLKSQLICATVCNDVMIDLIDNLPEDDLAALLKNWTGSSIVLDRSYSVQVGESLCFRTCTLTLIIPESLISESTEQAISRDALIALLTSPITYIRD